VLAGLLSSGAKYTSRRPIAAIFSNGHPSRPTGRSLEGFRGNCL